MAGLELKSRLNLKFSLVLLTSVMVLACVGFALYGRAYHGASGVVAALVAFALCWVPAVAALVFVSLMSDPTQVVNAVGLGMLFRMGAPLAAGLFLMSTGGPLVEAGVMGMIVGFYLIGLAVETFLAVRLLSGSGDQVSKAA